MISNLIKNVLGKWKEGWQCLFNTINELTDEDLPKEIKIRNAAQSVMDAINRQLAYSYHVGQSYF